jgi:hypothetical protein
MPRAAASTSSAFAFCVPAEPSLYQRAVRGALGHGLAPHSTSLRGDARVCGRANTRYLPPGPLFRISLSRPFHHACEPTATRSHQEESVKKTNESTLSLSLGRAINCQLSPRRPIPQVLRDADNQTALDYARQQEIFELLRDYIEHLYPNWTEQHPVSFDFGLTFDEGVWKLQQVRNELCAWEPRGGLCEKRGFQLAL